MPGTVRRLTASIILFTTLLLSSPASRMQSFQSFAFIFLTHRSPGPPRLADTTSDAFLSYVAIKRTKLDTSIGVFAFGGSCDGHVPEPLDVLLLTSPVVLAPPGLPKSMTRADGDREADRHARGLRRRRSFLFQRRSFSTCALFGLVRRRSF